MDLSARLGNWIFNLAVGKSDPILRIMEREIVIPRNDSLILLGWENARYFTDLAKDILNPKNRQEAPLIDEFIKYFKDDSWKLSRSNLVFSEAEEQEGDEPFSYVGFYSPDGNSKPSLMLDYSKTPLFGVIKKRDRPEGVGLYVSMAIDAERPLGSRTEHIFLPQGEVSPVKLRSAITRSDRELKFVK